MQKYFLLLVISAGLLDVAPWSFGEQPTPEQMVENIHWLGQAAVRIQAGDRIIYLDPFQIREEDRANIVLITHSHQDHYSADDVAKVLTEKTVLIAPKDCADKMKGKFANQVIISRPGMRTTVEGVQVEAVPAYNVVKTKFHPKENQWVGYILTIDGVRIYHAGDTERTPEMKNIRCDIALLPLGQTYTMNSVQEAADAALDVKASIAIPIHYGQFEGKASDAEEFKKLLQGKVTVVIKPKE